MSDIKKGRSPSAPLEPNNADNYSTINEDNLNIQTPAFQRLLNSNEGEEDEKVCRICLEEDSPETMIAPCLCKGGSKWVHRECLDEWRTNERDRAFSKCTECLFEYHLQPIDKGEGCCGKSPQERRRTLFFWMVSRDACLGIVLQQLIVLALAALIMACDPRHELPKLFLPRSSSASAPQEIAQSTNIWIYYALGWFTFFVGLGLYGSVVVCMNGCDIKRSIPRVGPPSEADEETEATPSRARSIPTANSTSNGNYNYSHMERNNDGYHSLPRDSTCSSSTTFYRRARRRHYHRRHYYYNDYYFGPRYYPMYVYPGNDGCCCCCCCCDSGTHHTSACYGDGCFRGCGHIGSMHSAISRSTSSGSRNNQNDGQHIVLMILLVVAIVLAIIGFFVGVVIVVVAAQRIVGRHFYLLQKRQLVEEFQVMDLQNYDLDKPAPSTEGESNGSGIEMQDSATLRHPPPSAPAMPTEDVQYLKQLGLVDR